MFTLNIIYLLCILKITKMLLAEEQLPKLSEETKHLMSLDNIISRLLNSTKKEDGENLLKHLTEFSQKFKEFDDFVQKNGTYFSESAFYMMKVGMPLFIKVGYNSNQLATTFGWPEDKFKTFNSTMKSIQKLAVFFPLRCQHLVYTSFEELLKL